MSPNLVSVIIPIYNAEDYLEKTINSVLNQSYDNLEVICINDGSTDDSSRILEKLKKIDNRIRVIEQKNSGVSIARNRGISSSRGEYVLFLDADDLLSREAIGKCVALIEKHKSNAVAFNMKILLPNGDLITCFGLEHFKKKFLVSFSYNYPPSFNFTNAATFLFRRDFLIDHGIFFKPNQIYEDWIFMVNFLSFNPKIVFIDRCFYIYRIQANGGSNITNNVSRSCLDIFKSYAYSRNIMINKGLGSEFLFINDRKILLESVSFLRNRLSGDNNKKMACEYIKEIKEVASKHSLLYLQCLTQSLPEETITSLKAIRAKNMRGNRELNIEIRKKWLVDSLVASFRCSRNIIKNLTEIVKLAIFRETKC